MHRMLAAVLIAASCADGDLPLSAAVRPHLDAPFTLRIGQSAVFDEPAIVITFDTVPHESRCPRDVVCVWAGDAVARLTLHVGPPGGDGPDMTANLHVNGEPRSTPVGAYYELRLLALDPEPLVSRPSMEPYRATLVLRSP